MTAPTTPDIPPDTPAPELPAAFAALPYWHLSQAYGQAHAVAALTPSRALADAWRQLAQQLQTAAEAAGPRRKTTGPTRLTGHRSPETGPGVSEDTPSPAGAAGATS